MAASFATVSRAVIVRFTATAIGTIRKFPTLTTCDPFKIFVGNLHALLLGKRKQLLGSAAFRDAFLLFGSEIAILHLA
jgi:hypothetical protein